MAQVEADPTSHRDQEGEQEHSVGNTRKEVKYATFNSS